MDKYQSTRLSFVPKQTSVRRSNRITPMNGQRQYRNTTNQRISNEQEQSPSFIVDNIESSSNNQFRGVSQPGGGNPSIFAASERSNQFRNSNAKDGDNNHKRRLKTWFILTAISLTVITLIAMIMNIYLLIIINKTPTTTTVTCNPLCLNGGTCSAPNTCTCNTDAWSGSICQTPVHIFWAFDSTLQDLYNNFNGIGNSTPTYQSPGYNGAGSCLWLSRSSSQSVTIPTPPFLNMAYTSFTFEAWMYAQTLCTNSGCTDNALFGQFDQNTLDRSLHIIVRNRRIYFGFFDDDVSGNQTLSTNQWYHMAYIYDYSTRTQYVYVNGYLDMSRSSAGPYQGTTGTLTIGTNGVLAPNNYFDGCLDSIAYFGRAKNATEVLLDATLVAYLPFDGNTLLDSGPLSINGTGLNYTYTSSGRVKSALTLPNLSSYAQITGLRRIGTNSWPYSVAIWIFPTSLAGGTIMHLSTRTDGAPTGLWCLAIMGLTSSGQIAINSYTGSNVPVTGPSVPLNTWTHVVGTYSPTNGERLYVNGTLRASVGGYAFIAGGVPMTITLGSSLLGTGVCGTGTIQAGRFYGSLDEFYVYARELTASEILALFNV